MAAAACSVQGCSAHNPDAKLVVSNVSARSNGDNHGPAGIGGATAPAPPTRRGRPRSRSADGASLGASTPRGRSSGGTTSVGGGAALHLDLISQQERQEQRRVRPRFDTAAPPRSRAELISRLRNSVYDETAFPEDGHGGDGAYQASAAAHSRSLAGIGGSADGARGGISRRGGMYSATAERAPAVSGANAGDLGSGAASAGGGNLGDDVAGGSSARETGSGRGFGSSSRGAGSAIGAAEAASIGSVRKEGAVLLFVPAVADVADGIIAAADAAEPPATRRRIRGKQTPPTRTASCASSAVQRPSVAAAVVSRPPNVRRDGEPPT